MIKQLRKKLLGKEIKVWWHTGNKDNRAKILDVLPYTGSFTQYFDCVLRLPAPNTHRGWLEMAYRVSDFNYDQRKP